MKSLDDKAPRILHIDIETTPNKAYVWGLFNQNVGINQIVEPGSTLCFAAAWEDTLDEYYFYSVWGDGFEAMVDAAWQLLDEADAVVHFNGKRFDIPTLQREFLLLGMPPPSDYWQVDLYHVVRSKFRFASNKLDYVCQQLDLGEKLQHKGMDLWTGCMSGNQEDLQTMEDYNIQDVDLLPLLYHKLRPWITQHPNMGLWENSYEHTCPNCGSHDVHQRGYRTTKVSIYPRYQCQNCFSWSRGRLRAVKTNEGILA